MEGDHTILLFILIFFNFLGPSTNLFFLFFFTFQSNINFILYFGFNPYFFNYIVCNPSI